MRSTIKKFPGELSLQVIRSHDKSKVVSCESAAYLFIPNEKSITDYFGVFDF